MKIGNKDGKMYEIISMIIVPARISILIIFKQRKIFTELLLALYLNGKNILRS